MCEWSGVARPPILGGMVSSVRPPRQMQQKGKQLMISETLYLLEDST